MTKKNQAPAMGWRETSSSPWAGKLSSHGLYALSPLGSCHAECPWCAKSFWDYVKQRNAQMRQVSDGETVSFDEAASTSVRPPR